jgi:Ca2+-binding RTX toxin-like protein
VTQATNLPGLAGSLFVLGIDAAGAKSQTVNFTIGTAYSFMIQAGVHFATAADPVLQGGHGAQMLIALSGNTTITAGPGKNVIYGGPGNDVLTGGAGRDMIYGGAGTDTIIGGSGMDILTGGAGTDTIYAGTGRSILIGGTGTDRFVFAPGHTGGLTVETADAIQHFRPVQGDLIDLSAFDALLPAGGTGHLGFIGTAAFDGKAGEVRYDVTSSGLLLECDLTGAGTADFMITLKNIAGLAAADFVL